MAKLHQISLGIVILCLQAHAAAPTSIDSVIDTVFATHQFREVCIAPDGSRLAWIESWPLDESTYQNHLVVEDLATHRLTPVGAGASTKAYGITWSPDSTQLAFLADDANDGRFKLHIRSVTNGADRTLTAVAGDVSTPRWSPNGKEIAMLVKAVAPKDTSRPGTWAHRDLIPQRLVVVNVAAGSTSTVGPANLFMYEYDWSPDGRHFAVTGAVGDGNDNWWYAKLFRIDRDTEKAVELVKPELQIAVPRWSLDGKSIAYVTGLMSDFIAPGGNISVVPSNGGIAVDVTPHLEGSATWVAWRDPHTILFTEELDGHSAVASVDTASKVSRVLWEGPESLSTGGLESALSVSEDTLKTATIQQSFHNAPEIWAGDVGHWQQVSNANSKLVLDVGEAKSLHWISDGTSVQGWLLYPTHYDAARKYPMVVLVHGGPAGDSQSKWAKPFYNMEALSSQGYFVLYPNARGSLGFGETFTQGNVRDLGYGDLRDITNGVKTVLSQMPVDPKRVGITGWSYGGYMAMWAITQTGLFQASVAGPGVSNWQSYYGQVDIEKWLLPYFKASVYDDPEIYNRSSPINFVKHAKTPTLMFAGEVDWVCPSTQSYELWRALGDQGVPTDLVIYPGETHGMVIPANQRAVTKEALAWFNKYLPAGK